MGIYGVPECADDDSSRRSTWCRVRQRPRPHPPLRFLSKYPRLPPARPQGAAVETGTRARQATERRLVEHPLQQGEVECSSQFMVCAPRPPHPGPAGTGDSLVVVGALPRPEGHCDKAARGGGPGRRLLAEEPQKIPQTPLHFRLLLI